MNPRALIVDDRGDWRDLLERAVERVGVKSDSASTIARALELIRRQTHALYLLDANLGTEQGVRGCTEILAELQAQSVDAPIIVLSGSPDFPRFAEELRKSTLRIRTFEKDGGMLELDDLLRDVTGHKSSPGRPVQRLDDLLERLEYRFAFMRLDVVAHSEMYVSNRGHDVDVTLESFEDFVEHEVKGCQGEIFAWQGDGGLVAFLVGDKEANCVSAALGILYALGTFNLSRNRLGSDIKLRIACHAGVAKYKAQRGRIHSAAINFVCHLEAKETEENTICISEPVYVEITEGLRKKFVAKGGFGGLAIYEHRR